MKFSIWVILIAVSIFCPKHALCAEDPSYKEKPLSVWMGELRNKQSQEIRDQAQEAIRQIGTNALPFLLEEMRVLGVLWKNDITNFYNTPAIMARFVNMRSAFETLGPIAKPAIPVLMSRINDNGLTADTVEFALTKIDPKVAVVVLTEVLRTNQNNFIRCAAINNLYNVATNAGIAVPALIQCLSERGDTRESHALRLLAIQALGVIGKAPEKTVPALTQTLKDEKNFVLRAAAARSLGAFETMAQPALPVLRQISTNDVDARVRAAAVAAIKKIENQSP